MVFFNTDGQTHRRTHKLNTKRITPLPYTGMGENFFIPHFFYLSQNGVSSLRSLTPFCSDKKRTGLAHLKKTVLRFVHIYCFFRMRLQWAASMQR